MTTEQEIPRCVGTDFELWYGPADDVDPSLRETPAERDFRDRTAKGVCADCPFIVGCLETELAYGIGRQWGVRGGLTADERQELLRQRRETAERTIAAELAVA